MSTLPGIFYFSIFIFTNTLKKGFIFLSVKKILYHLNNLKAKSSIIFLLQHREIHFLGIFDSIYIYC